MVRIKYVKKLEDLQENVMLMGKATMTSVRDILKALKTTDINLAQKVIENDLEIDTLDRRIESQCMSLLALEQPMAGDLRVIATSLKMITDLERIGDFAVDIAEEIVRMDTPLSVTIADEKFDNLMSKVKSMVADSIDTYAKADIKRAKTFDSRDDEVDTLYRQIVGELVNTLAQGSCPPEHVSEIASLFYIIRYLERMADHAVNIGSRIIYMVEGDRLFI